MKFRTILADPPYSYRYQRVGREYKHAAADNYRTMTVQEIADLAVPTIAARSSCLFLWVPVPLLPDGLQIMQAWQYEYKSAIFWRKVMSQGMGWWFRGQVEMCLLGVRGNVKAFHAQTCNVIQSKVRRHSQKPDELYDLIEPVAPEPWVELFARAERPGWHRWGDEIRSSVFI